MPLRAQSAPSLPAVSAIFVPFCLNFYIPLSFWPPCTSFFLFFSASTSPFFSVQLPLPAPPPPLCTYGITHSIGCTVNKSKGLAGTCHKQHHPPCLYQTTPCSLFTAQKSWYEENLQCGYYNLDFHNLEKPLCVIEDCMSALKKKKKKTVPEISMDQRGLHLAVLLHDISQILPPSLSLRSSELTQPQLLTLRGSKIKESVCSH